MLWILESINVPVPGVHKLEWWLWKRNGSSHRYTSFYILEAWSCPFCFLAARRVIDHWSWVTRGLANGAVLLKSDGDGLARNHHFSFIQCELQVDMVESFGDAWYLIWRDECCYVYHHCRILFAILNPSTDYLRRLLDRPAFRPLYWFYSLAATHP